MPLLLWNEEYNLGLSPIDEQHQGLLALVNQLHEALAVGESRRVLGEIFEALKRYVQEHFRCEEELMQQSQFPGRQEHVLAHAIFAAKVDHLFLQFLHSASFLIGIELMRFLREWIEQHLQEADQAYILHLQAQQGAVQA